MFEPLTTPSLSCQLLEIVHNPRLRTNLERGLGDYCHQFRNRLNSLKLSIYLAKRQTAPMVPSSWKTLEAAYQALEDQLGRVQKLCRPIDLTPVQIELSLLFNDRRDCWSRLMASAGRELKFLEPADQAIVRFDVNQLGQALDELVAWRAEQGASPTLALVAWWVEAGQAHVTWSEPQLFNPAAHNLMGTSGSPWTLPILTRIVDEHGGQVQIDHTNGWQIAISWPATAMKAASNPPEEADLDEVNPLH